MRTHQAAGDAHQVEPVQGAAQKHDREEGGKQHLSAAHHLWEQHREDSMSGRASSSAILSLKGSELLYGGIVGVAQGEASVSAAAQGGKRAR